MSVKKLLGAISRGIRDDVARCGALQPMLEKQQRLLAATDAEGLAMIGSDITDVVGELDNSARERSRYLTELGLQADQRGMKTLVEKLPATLASELSGLWQQLETALARCKGINERNGELLSGQRDALAGLMGAQVSGYGEAG